MSREHVSDLSAPLWRCALVWSAVTALVALCLPLAATGARGLGTLPTATDVAAPVVDIASLALGVAAAWLWVITTHAVLSLLRGRASQGGLVRRLVLTACGAAVVLGAAVGPAQATSPDPTGRDQVGTLSGLPLPERTDDASAAGADQETASRPQATRAGTGSSPDQAPRPAEPSEAAAPQAAAAQRPGAEEPRAEAPSRTGEAPHAESRDRHGPTRTRTVAAGDSLWSIAEERLGPGASQADVDRAWRAIWRANAAALGQDPDLIHPGQHLRLPTTPSSTPSSTQPTPEGEQP